MPPGDHAGETVARAEDDHGDPYPGEPASEREDRAYALTPTGADGLASEDPSKQVLAREAILERYKAVGHGLASVALTGVNRESDPGAMAMRLLGKTRFDGAVVALAHQVDLKLTRALTVGKRPVEGEAYPAAYALAQIGMPSVPWMSKNLAESDDETVRDRSAWVINTVLMGKKSAARVFLEDAIKEAQDDKQRDRLVAAREFFE
jgi:hypothetical protein